MLIMYFFLLLFCFTLLLFHGEKYHFVVLCLAQFHVSKAIPASLKMLHALIDNIT